MTMNSELGSTKTAQKRSLDECDVQDWCLIESDPAIFTDMCQTYGVKGVKVEEVYDTDLIKETSFGLIFASEYNEDEPIPDDIHVQQDMSQVFFACQVINNMCATIALLGVLFNISHLVDIGQHLSNLKNILSNVDSVLRGVALGNDKLLRETHNSFASAQTKFRAKHPHRPKKKRRGRPPKASVVDDTKVHHYTAYVPIGGYIWELDGMKRYPIKVAPIPEGQSWVETVKPLLRKQMLQSGSFDFSIMSVEPTEPHSADDNNEKVDRMIDQVDLQLNSMDHEALDRSFDLDAALDSQEETTASKFVKLEMERAARERLLALKEKLYAKKNTKHAVRATNDFEQLSLIRRKHDYLPFVQTLLFKICKNGKKDLLLKN